MKRIRMGIVLAIISTTGANAQWLTNGAHIYTLNSGNVGIGAMTPAQKLDVIGASAQDTYVRVLGGAGSTKGGFLFGNNDGGTYTYGGLFFDNAVNGVTLNQRYATGYLGLGANSRVSDLVILASNGNVGIGTVTPTEKLTVSSAVTDAFIAAYGGSGSSKGGIKVGVNSTSYGALYFDNSSNNIVLQQQYASGDLALGTNSTTKVTIKSAGNVGIGTSSPLAKLDVNGNIYSSTGIYVGVSDVNTSTKMAGYLLAVNGNAIFTKATVKIFTNWPDYVFAPEYKLTSLDSLEKFINQNKHLPEIPSASEIEKNGLDLGSNQSLLLKKIEELTLIVIDQNKRIQQLEAYRAEHIEK